MVAPHPPVVQWWVLGRLTPPLFSVVWWWVLGLGFRVCTRAPRVVWVVGLFTLSQLGQARRGLLVRIESRLGWGCLGFRCVDIKGFRVEGQQLGAAQTETMAHPGECCHFGHATKLHSFKSHNTHEDREFRVPIPVTVGTFETTVRPSPGYRVYTMGGGYLRGGLLTRNTFDKQPPNDHLSSALLCSSNQEISSSS